MHIKQYGIAESCTVKMSKELAKKCKPRQGEPKGPDFIPEEIANEKDIKKAVWAMFLKNGIYILKGTDTDFVCIPQKEYEYILTEIEYAIMTDNV